LLSHVDSDVVTVYIGDFARLQARQDDGEEVYAPVRATSKRLKSHSTLSFSSRVSTFS
jgi:hypothetical protein